MEFEHVKPMDIEKRSMEIIGQELAEMGISLPAMALCELCREDSLEEQARKIFTKKKR